MSNLVNKYKNRVLSSHKQHIVVADKACLFDYVEIMAAFESEGYTIIRCNSGLAVRVTFELQLRYSDQKSLIVAPAAYFPLPDIESQVNFQSIGLPDLFPNLDTKAIQGLSFNALCLLANFKPYEDLSYDKTIKFLLQNLYNVDFDTLTSNKVKERLLNAFITVFHDKNGINEPLIRFLSNIAQPYFPELVLEGLSNASIMKYIQEQWQAFVTKGSSLLDFKEPLLHKNLGYLISFEYLNPIQVSPNVYDNFPKLLKVGVYADENNHNDIELESLIEYLNQQLKIIEDIADEWFAIIRVLANAKLRYLSSTNKELKLDYQKIEDALNIRFQRLIDNTYFSLFSLSGARKPVVVSRILDHITANPPQKKALLVIDGMNYWQWKILGKTFTNAGIHYSQNATLAYIPTITAWSRQSIFKGAKPDLSTDNSKESKLFKDYWKNQGVEEYQIYYNKFGVNNPLRTSNLPHDVTIIALVCNDLDEIMHGSVLGDKQLKTSTEQWIIQSEIVESILTLLNIGFQVYLTSDHGNIEAKGLKNLTIEDRVGALSRGKRHLHFSNETLLQGFIDQNPNIELGKKGRSLYLRNQEAFTNENSQVITHGGSHIWEVIVPFITIHAK